jgi:hypothetical protein
LGTYKTPTLQKNTNPIIMSQKKAFVLRIDEKMLKELEKWAADDFRSINGQIEWILNQALKKQKRSKPE